MTSMKILTRVLTQVNKIQSRNVYTLDPNALGNKIGKREIVCFGMNGCPQYLDCCEFPYPAIRYKEVTPDIQALRDKEKGDWKKLSIEDKKALYRASFRQTFAEFEASSGEWKGAFGMALFGISIAMWVFVALKNFVYPPMPQSMSYESRRAQLEKMKVMRVMPITGNLDKYE